MNYQTVDNKTKAQTSIIKDDRECVFMHQDSCQCRTVCRSPSVRAPPSHAPCQASPGADGDRRQTTSELVRTSDSPQNEHSDPAVYDNDINNYYVTCREKRVHSWQSRLNFIMTMSNLLSTRADQYTYRIYSMHTI